MTALVVVALGLAFVGAVVRLRRRNPVMLPCWTCGRPVATYSEYPRVPYYNGLHDCDVADVRSLAAARRLGANWWPPPTTRGMGDS